MLWAVVSSVVLMVRVTQAMHQPTVRLVCAIGDVLGTVGGGPERGLPVVQRARVVFVMSMVRVPQVVDRVLMLTAGEGVAGDGRWRG